MLNSSSQTFRSCLVLWSTCNCSIQNIYELIKRALLLSNADENSESGQHKYKKRLIYPKINYNSIGSTFTTFLQKFIMQNSKPIKVAIIGAGLSGLSAADYILQQNPNVQVTVIEAMDRVGGRTYTKQILGTKFDLGAQFIGKTQKYTIQLANRSKQQFIPEVYQGEKVLLLNGQRSTYKSKIPSNVNFLALGQMQWCIWKINRMARKVPLTNPINCEMGQYWDSITIQNWMERNLWSQKVRLMFQAAVRVILGSQVGEVSFLYFLWFVHQNQSFDNLINIQNGLQQKKLKNGTQQMSFFLRSQIQKNKGRVELNQYVRQITQKNGNVYVKTVQDRQFECDYLILATSPSIFGRINFYPNLSPEKTHLAQKSFMGKLTKVIVLYQRQFWKQKGFSGQIVSDSSDSPIISCFDDSKLDENGQVKQPALIIFVGGQVYRYWKQKGTLDQRLCEKLSQAFLCEELKKPLAIQWYQFDEIKTIGGGPVGVMGPGTLSHIQDMRKPEGNIHFAGTQLATVSIGYMDGAIESGIRAGQEIIGKISNGSKSRLAQAQNDTQKDYPWYNKMIRNTKKFIQWW